MLWGASTGTAIHPMSVIFAGKQDSGMAAVSGPVENLGTQFYENGEPYLRKSSRGGPEENPTYGFHGQVGPFYAGIPYTFRTTLTGFLDWDTGSGPAFETVYIIIPFELNRRWGNPEIALGPIAGSLLGVTTPTGCGNAPPTELA
jgi:hypothetical protein